MKTVRASIPIKVKAKDGEKGDKGDTGKNGEANVTIDLDNEIGCVGCDNGGTVETGLPLVTAARMYYGTEEMTIDEATISSPTGITATIEIDEAKKSATATVTAIAQAVADTSELPITLKATQGGKTYTRTATFRINKIRSGKDGAAAVIYELQPTTTAIKRLSTGAYSPTSIACVLRCTSGTEATTVATLPDGYTMKYSCDGATAVSYTIGTSLQTSGLTKSLTFFLYCNDVIVDRETVVVVIDGTNGSDGHDGQDGEDAITLRTVDGSAAAFTAVKIGTDTVTRGSTVYLYVEDDSASNDVALFKGETQITSGVTFAVSPSQTQVGSETTITDDVIGVVTAISGGAFDITLEGSTTMIKARPLVDSDGNALTDSDGNARYVPLTNAALTVKATYGGKTYSLTMPITVDYTKTYAELIANDEEWATKINRIQSNLNLLDDIPMNKISDTVVGITDDEVTELFLNKTLYPTTATATTAAPYFKANTEADEGIRVTTFKWYKTAQYLVFRRKYADHVTDYPKAGNVLYLTMRYRTSGACRIFCGMNAINTATSEQYDHWKNIDESPYTETTTTNSDGTTTTTKHYQWQTVTLKVDTSKLTGAATDRLYIRLYARSADSSFSIYNMTLLREGGQLVQTMGYVDVKADEVTLGVKNDLSDTGIDITAHQIKAKADNFVVVNNDGEETLAVNSKGELKAGSVVSENDEQKIELTGGMLSAMTDDTDGKTGFSFTTLNSSPVLAYYGNGIMKWYLCEEGIKYIVTGGIELVAKSSKATTKASATTSNGMTTVKVYYTATVMITNTGSSSIKISSLSIRAGRQYSNGTLEGKYSSTITLSAGGTASYTITTDTETKTFSGTSYPVPNYGNLIEVLCDSTLLGTIEADKASA